jgi:hypothetical protein
VDKNDPLRRRGSEITIETLSEVARLIASGG